MPAASARAFFRTAAGGNAMMTTSVQSFGLFDPAQEKASCGVGFIADIKGR